MDIERYIFQLSDSDNADDKELLKEINKSIKILNDSIQKYGIESSLSSSSSLSLSLSLSISISTIIIIIIIITIGIESISLSFNGGKDACIVLQLYRYVLYKYNTNTNTNTNNISNMKDIRILYFSTPNEFTEIEEFMMTIQRLYEINYIKYDCPMKDGMRIEVEERGTKCVIIGTRIGDPYTDEKTPHIQPSSNDWPEFVRINPIIKWSYKQVWSFLRDANLPYCKLYDDGYTSLGTTINTFKNEALKQTDDNGNTYYLPAYLLQDEALERNTRI